MRNMTSSGKSPDRLIVERHLAWGTDWFTYVIETSPEIQDCRRNLHSGDYYDGVRARGDSVQLH